MNNYIQTLERTKELLKENSILRDRLDNLENTRRELGRELLRIKHEMQDRQLMRNRDLLGGRE